MKKHLVLFLTLAFVTSHASEPGLRRRKPEKKTQQSIQLQPQQAVPQPAPKKTEIQQKDESSITCLNAPFVFLELCYLIITKR